MTVTVRILGGFGVDVDGVPVAPEAWSRRHAASLVKLLALVPGRRLHRERMIEALWPGLPVDSAAPRLHKAAHYARRALGDDGSVVLRSDFAAAGHARDAARCLALSARDAPAPVSLAPAGS